MQFICLSVYLLRISKDVFAHSAKSEENKQPPDPAEKMPPCAGDYGKRGLNLEKPLHRCETETTTLSLSPGHYIKMLRLFLLSMFHQVCAHNYTFNSSRFKIKSEIRAGEREGERASEQTSLIQPQIPCEPTTLSFIYQFNLSFSKEAPGEPRGS